MINLVIRFLETLLTFATAIALGVSVLVGTRFANTWDLGPIGSILGAIIGAVVGLFMVAIVLGIPILLLRINQNLEKIHTEMARRSTHVPAPPSSQGAVSQIDQSVHSNAATSSKVTRQE